MDLNKIVKEQRRFVTARDWAQFHSPKNLVMALMIEAGELAEHFQWLTPEASRRLDRAVHAKVEEEVADVFAYLLRVCDVLGIDLERAFWKKMRKNKAKYPVKLAKGSMRKYTELDATVKKSKKAR